ncbi:MAG: response regulator [Lachnospiraceae bacterium]|jgi:putative two-component system response regulator|nr:response regulator [Lachnospiraceae bacterium]
MKNILAVDDNPANLTLVRETLRDQYKVNVVTSGEQAIRFVGIKTPDLILLDICMPGMDGIATLKELNKIPDKNWKVVILTAVADKEIETESKQLGAVGFIAKPFVPEEMIETIHGLLA